MKSSWISFVTLLIISISIMGISNTSFIGHDPDNFLRLYNDWKSICSRAEFNTVLHPYGGFTQDTKKTVFPWTLDHENIHIFADFQRLKPLCQNIDDMIKTISLPVIEYKCTVRWLSSFSICLILEKYAGIYFLGDSLTRHMSMAFYMLLNRDLRYGGFPIDPNINPKIFGNNCGCDGQFSENKLCREYDTKKFTFTDARANGFCRKIPNYKNVKFSYFDDGFYDPKILLCGDNPSDQRPILLFLQGGTQFYTNSTIFIEKFLSPNLLLIKQHLEACPIKISIDRIRVIFTGVPVTKGKLEKLYKLQERSRAAMFNSEVSEYVSLHIPKSLSLNFWNLTMESLDRSSDGFHAMTDVNLIKMMITFNAMDFLVDL
jgi:hypothetical protein